MKIPSSSILSDLEWDFSFVGHPTLNCILKLGGMKIEIALIGEKGSELSWGAFVKSVESYCLNLNKVSSSILERAGKEIRELYDGYFSNKWLGETRGLLNELQLYLVCFYPDGTRHFWYKGSDVFNNLDLDIGLNPISEIIDVRFDG